MSGLGISYRAALLFHTDDMRLRESLLRENDFYGIRVHVAAQDDNLLVTTSGLEEVERVQEERTHGRNFLRTFEAEERGRILADSLEGRPYNSDEWRTIIKWNTPFTNQKTGADSDAQPRASH